MPIEPTNPERMPAPEDHPLVREARTVEAMLVMNSELFNLFKDLQRAQNALHDAYKRFDKITALIRSLNETVIGNPPC